MNDCLICELRATILLDIARRSRAVSNVIASPRLTIKRELLLHSLRSMMAIRRDLDSLCEHPHSTTQGNLSG